LVVGAVLIVGSLIVALVIFKDDIANFLSGGLTGAVEGTQESLEGLRTSIFDAGAGAGRAFAEKQAIETAERDIEKAALDSGFESVEAFNKATDSGSIVIGGERTTVDFGLIGNVIPTNPSREFIQSEEGRKLFETNPTFRDIVNAQKFQESSTPEQVNALTVFPMIGGDTGNISETDTSLERFGGRRRR